MKEFTWVSEGHPERCTTSPEVLLEALLGPGGSKLGIASPSPETNREDETLGRVFCGAFAVGGHDTETRSEEVEPDRANVMCARKQNENAKKAAVTPL